MAMMVVTLTVPTVAQGAEVSEHPNLVSDQPSNNTPHVIDGYVTGVVQVGANTIAVGNFSQVRNPGNNTPVMTRNNIFSFNTASGQINSGFVPAVDGEVTDVISANDGDNIFIAGNFNSVNGDNARKVAKLNAVTGNRVSGFGNPAFNGRVAEVQLANGVLYAVGRFTAVGSNSRTLLAGLDPNSGALLPDVNLVFAEPRKGAMTIYGMDISPDGSQMIVMGNFQQTEGQERRQIAKLDLGSNGQASLADWSTQRYAPACAGAFNTYMRDVEYSPDGEFFVVVTTGAYFAGTLCDTAARFESSQTGSGISPTWVDYTGGDTLTAVTITDRAVYVGGHQRWMNNPYAGDRWGPGAVEREGLAALDVRNGVPFTWDPGRTRGYGVYELAANTGGMWITSDTDRISGWQYRGRMAYMPLAGGAEYPNENIGSLDESLYVIGASSEDNEQVLVQRDFSPAGVASSTEIETGTDWSQVRAGFMIDGVLYTAHNDGTMQRRSFNGTSFGASEAVDTLGLNAFVSELANMTGAFYDSERARLYFTRSGSNTLYYRYFVPESQIMGAEVYSSPSNGASLNWGRTTAVFLSGDQLMVADNTGNLSSWQWDAQAGNVVPDSKQTESGPQIDGIDWSARDAFLYAADEPQQSVSVPDPRADFDTTVSGSLVNFDASSSNTEEGSISSYEWDLGDGTTATGELAQHSYTETGNYTVTLTITTSTGETASSSRLIQLGGEFSGPVAPADVYGAAVYNDQPDLYWRLGESEGNTAADSSGAGNEGTYYRSVNRGAEGALAGVSDAAIELSNNQSFNYGWLASNRTATNPGPFSIEIWFKTDTTGGGTLASFGNRNDQLSSQHDRKIFMLNNGQLVFGTYPGSEARATTNETFNDNQWHHVVATQGVEGMKLYVDGTLRASHAATSAENFTGYWKVGAETSWSGPSRAWFIGALDEFAIYGYPMDEATIAEHYTLGSNEPPANQLPVAEFSLQANGLQIGVDASASSDPDGSITSYSWDFGDGNTANGIFLNHTYEQDGEYQVSLTVTDNRGDTATVTQEVTVEQLPNQLPEAAIGLTGAGLQVALDASGSTDTDGAIASYEWDLGDGTTQSGASIEHEYAEAGTYTITLTVTDDRNGSHSATVDYEAAEVQPLVFIDSAEVSMTSNQARVTLPSGIQAGDGLLLLTASNSTGHTMADPSGVTGWEELGEQATGGVHSRAFSKVAAATDAGAQLTLATSGTIKTSIHVLVYRGIGDNWVQEANGLITSSSSTEKQAPSVNVGQAGSTVVSYWADKGSVENPVTPPESDTVRGTAAGTGGGRMTSAVSDRVEMVVGEHPGAIAQLQQSSTRTAVWSVVLNPSGGAPIVLNEPPVADFTVSSDGLEVSIDASASSDPDGEVAGYSWDFGDGNTGNGVSASHNYAEAGTYTISLVVTDNSGASSTAVEQEVTVEEIVIDPEPEPGVGETVEFVAASETNLSSSVPQLAVPAQVTEGDGLLLMATVNSSNPTVSEPSGVTGWTLEDSLIQDGTQTFLYSKVAEVSDPESTVVLGLSSIAKTGMHLLAYRGIGEDWVQDVNIELIRDAGTEKFTPSATATGEGVLAIGFWADKGGITNELTPGPGLVALGATSGSGGGRITSLVAHSDGPVAAGTVGDLLATTDNSAHRTVSMIITLRGKE
ncbi:PKD domain-containing protein [Glutamicibacter uratoxydans]|uniref:PKD domain-containing protein n=1 Tax=Glutamicibacter uratoxydans TaxID=43667 RepID=UPI003D6F6B2B